MYFDGNGTGEREGTEPMESQIEGLYPSAFIKGRGVVHEDYAAVADLKWVEDNWQLENEYNADVGFRPDSKDGLEFRVPLASTPEPPSNVLGLGNFEGEWFNVVDVLSNIARYADNDVLIGELPGLAGEM